MNANDFVYDENGNPSVKKLAVCVAALLLQMAYADQNFHETEFNEIIKRLSKSFDLLDEESADIVEIVRFLNKDEKDIDEFIDVINKFYSESQREYVYQAILKVGVADGVVDSREVAVAHNLRERLKLPKE